MNRVVACLLAIALSLVTVPAFADEAQAQHEIHTDFGEVEVSADGDAAYIEGSTFAIDSFSRAQKGSNRELDGKYIGYSYYQGATADYCVAVVLKDAVICYVPPSMHGLCDISDPTSTEQVKAYFTALDEVSLTGGVTIGASADWVFVDEQSYTRDEIVYSFDVDVSGKYYVTILPEGATNEGELDATSIDLPNFVEFGKIVDPSSVDIIPASSGFAAVVEFLAGIDMSPFWVTLKTTGTAIVFIFILGLAAAYLTMRVPKLARDIFDTIFTIPMVLPPTVCGFLLLSLLGRNTPIGAWFIDIGFPLIFSWPATVIAATVVAFPLMYRSCRGAFENLDANMLDAARTLGWSNAKIFFKLMIPLSWSSIAAATVLAFARALGEFGATLFLAGNYVGITRTIPIAIYFEWMAGNDGAAWFWTGVILVFSFVVILFINLWSRHTTRYRKKDAGKKAGKLGSPPKPGSHHAEPNVVDDTTLDIVDDGIISSGGRA